MNLTIPNRGTCKIKVELQITMSRMLELLREILASVHEERMVFEADDIPSLNKTLDRRKLLLEAFEDCYLSFSNAVNDLSGQHGKLLSLVQRLEWLQLNLDPEDFEHLLLVEQLSCISKEMMGETNSLLYILEHKSASIYFKPMLQKKAASQVIRTTLGLADENESLSTEI